MASPLITADELARILDRGDVRIVDCRWDLANPERAPEEYRSGHLPGAVFASLDDDLTAPVGPGRHPLPTPARFGESLSRLGITPNSRVVVYDDSGGGFAARLWWMLTDQGHEQTSVLDGGIQAWVAGGNSLDMEAVIPPRGGMETRPWTRIVDRDQVVARPEHTVVIDARIAERYRGESEPIDPIAGHIPGAVSVPHPGNLAPDLTLRDPGTLRSRFSEVGVTDAEHVIVYCGSGVTTCLNILAMEIAGIGRPWLYEGSWSDWCSTDLPIATGDAP
ncbi:MAG: sulfurtransferase [Actinomycetota bacterium]